MVSSRFVWVADFCTHLTMSFPNTQKSTISHLKCMWHCKMSKVVTGLKSRIRTNLSDWILTRRRSTTLFWLEKQIHISNLKKLKRKRRLYLRDIPTCHGMTSQCSFGAYQWTLSLWLQIIRMFLARISNFASKTNRWLYTHQLKPIWWDSSLITNDLIGSIPLG